MNSYTLCISKEIVYNSSLFIQFASYAYIFYLVIDNALKAYEIKSTEHVK